MASDRCSSSCCRGHITVREAMSEPSVSPGRKIAGAAFVLIVVPLLVVGALGVMPS